MRSQAAAATITPAPRSAWAEIAAGDPHATIFQTPAWVDAMCRTGRYVDVSRLYLTDGEAVVLPLVRPRVVPARLAVDASPPAYWSTGGIVRTGGPRIEDVGMLWDDVLKSQTAGIRIRPSHEVRAAWRAGTPTTVAAAAQQVHVLDLTGGYGEVWKNRLSGSVRRAVRKAESAGLDVEIGSSESLARAMHELYVTWLRQRADDRGIPRAVFVAYNPMRESVRKFKAVAAALQDSCRFIVARRHGELLAGVILMTYGEHASYWRGYSDLRQAGPTRANNLLQHLAIQEACARGCRTYNMGESGGVASLIEFKTRHGAVAQSFDEYHYERLPYSTLRNARIKVEALLGRGLTRRSP